MTFTPWTFITVAIAGWMNRQQQQVIEYLRGDAFHDLPPSRHGVSPAR